MKSTYNAWGKNGYLCVKYIKKSALAPWKYSNIQYTTFIDPPISACFWATILHSAHSFEQTPPIEFSVLEIHIPHPTLHWVHRFQHGEFDCHIVLLGKSNWHRDCSMHSYMLRRLGEIFHHVNCRQIEPTYKKWLPTVDMVILLPISLIPSTLE